ncbi:MAG: hypothetical protein GXP25_12810 [Planctomycetes bacterium]|nr:hypothetical protein [Planctomycetota bacterium]
MPETTEHDVEIKEPDTVLDENDDEHDDEEEAATQHSRHSRASGNPRAAGRHAQTSLSVAQDDDEDVNSELRNPNSAIQNEEYVPCDGPGIEIFRAGDYPQGRFSEEDLELIAESYDPSLHEAPITLDHHNDGPAYGWVGRVKRIGRKLVAIPSLVTDKMRQLLRSGEYRKVSAEIYTDFMGLGKPYLKAVSFLGARVPAVKGLAPAKFHEEFGESVRVEFKEQDTLTEEQVAAMLERALAPVRDENESLKQRALTAEAQVAALEERDRQREAAARRGRIAAFCEDLKEQGKLLPAWEDMGLRAFLETLSDRTTEKVVIFQEDGQEATVSQLSFMESFLGDLPQVIEFGEIARAPATAPARVMFRAEDADNVVNEELRDVAVTIFDEENAKGNRTTFSEALRMARARMAE